MMLIFLIKKKNYFVPIELVFTSLDLVYGIIMYTLR